MFIFKKLSPFPQPLLNTVKLDMMTNKHEQKHDREERQQKELQFETITAPNKPNKVFHLKFFHFFFQENIHFI